MTSEQNRLLERIAQRIAGGYISDKHSAFLDAVADIKQTLGTELASLLADAECIKIIDELRKDEGDLVQICCQNPEPSKPMDSEQVICGGFWTMKNGDWREMPFMGKTVLEALRNAYEHRQALQNKKED